VRRNSGSSTKGLNPVTTFSDWQINSWTMETWSIPGANRSEEREDWMALGGKLHDQDPLVIQPPKTQTVHKLCIDYAHRNEC
jgi:hypothetical protein